MKPDHESPTVSETVQFACPTCSPRPALESLQCPVCSFEGTERRGIVTFPRAPDRRDSSREPDETLEELAMLAEQTTIRRATTQFVAGTDPGSERRSLVDELFDVERDAWLPLTADRVDGRCLHVGAGFGRRTSVLAELADEVHAVEPSLSKIRVLAARDDVDGGTVVPVHTSRDRLPFPDGSFDTIVTEWSPPVDRSARAHLDRLADLLADGGTLICTVDGWTDAITSVRTDGVETTVSTLRDRLGFATPESFRSAGEAAGFDRTDVYAIVPSASRPLYTFDPESDGAVSELLKFVFPDGGPVDVAGSAAGRLAQRCGLLERCHPGYLVVYDDDPRPRSIEWTDPLLVSGRARSVVLETSADGIDRVTKLPNRSAHARLNDRETEVLEGLRGRSTAIADVLPTGSAIRTPLGTGRREKPVEGTPLNRGLTRDVDSFRRTLERGFSWLAEFHDDCRRERVRLSPREVESMLAFEPAGVEPPTVTEPVETFRTAVHGDYTPQNVYVEDGDVVSVIDWEYGSLDADPVVDAGFLVIITAHECFDGFEPAHRAVFREPTEYAAAAGDLVRRYCDRVGLPYRTFDLLLPLGYVHRLELDWEHDAASTYTSKLDGRRRLLERMYDSRPAVARRTADVDRPVDEERDDEIAPGLDRPGHLDDADAT